MATMFFAGIPLEGSGVRPLEADLYGADGQTVDQENISATGNLNVGNIIQYDEHAERHMNGGVLNEDIGRSDAGQLPRDSFLNLPEVGAAGRSPAADPTNATLFQTTAYGNPALENDGGAKRLDNASPVSSQSETSSAPVSTNTFQSNSTSSETHDSTTSSSGNTTYNNTYNNNYENTTNITNVENNNTTNHTNGGGGPTFIDLHGISITNILNGGNNNGGGGHGDINILNNIFNSTILSESNFLNILNNNTLNIFHNDGSIPLVNIDIENVLNPIINIGATGGSDGLLTSIVNAGDHLVGSVTNMLGGNNGGDLLGGAVNTVNSTVGGLLGGGTGGNLLSTVIGVAGGAVNNIGDTLNHVLGGTQGNILEPVATTVNSVIGGLNGGLPGGDLLGSVTSALNNVLSDSQGNILQPVVETANNIMGGVNGGLTGVDVLGNITNSVNTVLSGAQGDILEPFVNSVNGALHDPNALLSLLQSAGGQLEMVISPVVEPVVSTAGGAVAGLEPTVQFLVDGAHNLLDVNVSALTGALPAADNHTLVNGDVTLFASTDSTPHAAGMGLLDVDTSLLSHGSAVGVTDGVSVSLNTNTVTHDVLPGLDMPTVNLTVPLHTVDQSVPLLTPVLDVASDLSHTLHDLTSSLLTPSIELAALTHTASSVAAIDAGVLFTGTSSTVGHDNSPVAVPDLHVGSLLQATGLVHHA